MIGSCCGWRVKEGLLIRQLLSETLPDVADFVHELVDGLVLAVNAHEAHVGDLVEPPEVLADVPADLFRGYFAVVAVKKLFFDAVHEALKLFVSNLEFVASALNAGEIAMTSSAVAPLSMTMPAPMS